MKEKPHVVIVKYNFPTSRIMYYTKLYMDFEKYRYQYMKLTES